jgi:hypothetical protein
VDTFNKLLEFIEKLEELKIWYQLRHVRDSFVMVSVDVPGYKWEIEFCVDGTVAIEIFASDGKIYDEEKLVEFFQKFSD